MACNSVFQSNVPSVECMGAAVAPRSFNEGFITIYSQANQLGLRGRRGRRRLVQILKLGQASGSRTRTHDLEVQHGCGGHRAVCTRQSAPQGAKIGGLATLEAVAPLLTSLRILEACTVCSESRPFLKYPDNSNSKFATHASSKMSRKVLFLKYPDTSNSKFATHGSSKMSRKVLFLKYPDNSNSKFVTHGSSKMSRQVYSLCLDR
ncbi:hypothetical protein RRG08_064658 [Elysia crispata]|uniref:Uncharacterized protein n=1 Tax=Elysia crispata TaxID=231223 RepID=A0AAE1ECW4_9GAST|nr:hypothetical protein RRG08_064658 [Elysia crispata]